MSYRNSVLQQICLSFPIRTPSRIESRLGETRVETNHRKYEITFRFPQRASSDQEEAERYRKRR